MNFERSLCVFSKRASNIGNHQYALAKRRLSDARGAQVSWQYWAFKETSTTCNGKIYNGKIWNRKKHDDPKLISILLVIRYSANVVFHDKSWILFSNCEAMRQYVRHNIWLYKIHSHIIYYLPKFANISEIKCPLFRFYAFEISPKMFYIIL